MSIHKKIPRGFTLFEIAVSIGILLIVIAGIGGFVIALQNARVALMSLQEVDSNLALAFGVMSQRIRYSESVNSDASIFNADPGVISLAMADASVNPTVFSLDHDNGTLLMQEGASPVLALTTDAVIVSQLIFSSNTGSGEPEDISIALTIDFNSPSGSYASFTHAATTSITLRK